MWQSVHQPTSVLNKIQFVINIKLQHVSTLGGPPSGNLGWYIIAETPKSLIPVNCILLNVFVGWYIGCKNVRGINNIKFGNVTDPVCFWHSVFGLSPEWSSILWRISRPSVCRLWLTVPKERNVSPSLNTSLERG